MIIKEFNYYLKDGMSLEEIRGTILEKVNSLSDPSTGCIAHVFDANALKYYIVASDNVATLHGLDRNILTFNDFGGKVSELNSRIDSVNTTLTQSINTKANQSTTYTKTEVDTRVNAKANSNAVVALSGNQTIAGVKTFSSPIVVPNGTANNHAVNLAQLNTKANANATVNLSGNQVISGTKTFSSPVIVHNATADNHAVNRAQLNTKADINYVKKRGGFVNVNFNLAGGQGILIDLNAGINFNVIVQRGVSANMRVINAASNIGQSGEIYVANGAGVSSFSAPFNLRVPQSGFGANEVFSYLVVSANLVRITRS